MDGDVSDTLRFLDLPLAEQVIEVPMISCSPCPSRSLVPEPQSAEQLMEVPTVLSPLLIAEQNVDTPVLLGRGKRRVQGCLPRQSSTATPSVERISERTVDRVRPHLLVLPMRILLGVFALFHGKKCGVPGRW